MAVTTLEDVVQKEDGVSDKGARGNEPSNEPFSRSTETRRILMGQVLRNPLGSHFALRTNHVFNGKLSVPVYSGRNVAHTVKRRAKSSDVIFSVASLPLSAQVCHYTEQSRRLLQFLPITFQGTYHGQHNALAANRLVKWQREQYYEWSS